MRRFRTDVERVLFALVANRAVAPASKLAAWEWVTRDAAVPGLDSLDGNNQALRAMDLLVTPTSPARCTVFFAAAHLLNLEVDLIFFDTTSTYFERDEEAGAEDADSLRRFGHSKDHRRDLPQIVIGLAVTREGIPVRCWVWPCNTTDTTVIEQVKDDLRSCRLGRVVTVADSGFSSQANLAYLRRAGATCGSKRSGWNTTRIGAGSCATTRARPTATPPAAPSSSMRSPQSWTGSPPPAPPTRPSTTGLGIGS
jgi:transposase